MQELLLVPQKDAMAARLILNDRLAASQSSVLVEYQTCLDNQHYSAFPLHQNEFVIPNDAICLLQIIGITALLAEDCAGNNARDAKVISDPGFVSGLSSASDLHLEHMLKHSYSNFHVSGVDYVCLYRSQRLTRKLYFYDNAPECSSGIVSPHDHRYDFSTRVLAGRLSNLIYEHDNASGRVFNRFSWDTPLNGGKGFVWQEETRLKESHRDNYYSGEEYFLPIHDIHTIEVGRETVILLDQFEDRLPVGVPTNTFFVERASPITEGCYEPLPVDRLLSRLKTFYALI